MCLTVPSDTSSLSCYWVQIDITSCRELHIQYNNEADYKHIDNDDEVAHHLDPLRAVVSSLTNFVVVQNVAYKKVFTTVGNVLQTNAVMGMNNHVVPEGPQKNVGMDLFNYLWIVHY